MSSHLSKADLDLAVFPECYFGLDPRSQEPIETDKEVLQEVAELAKRRRTHIVVGYLELAGEKRFKNESLLFSPSGLVGRYLKTTPYLGLERDSIPGDEVRVFQTEIGSISMLVCWEVWFPELARIAALKGAEIICLPTAKGYIGPLWQKIHAARAVENNSYVIMSTYANEGVSSLICSPEGWVVEGRGEGITQAEIDLDRLREIRQNEEIEDDFEPALLKRRSEFLRRIGDSMLSGADTRTRSRRKS